MHHPDASCGNRSFPELRPPDLPIRIVTILARLLLAEFTFLLIIRDES